MLIGPTPDCPSIPKYDFSGTISEEQEKTLQMMKMILPGYTQDVINKRNSVSYGSNVAQK